MSAGKITPYVLGFYSKMSAAGFGGVIGFSEEECYQRHDPTTNEYIFSYTVPVQSCIPLEKNGGELLLPSKGK